jgi:hypothetical protein
VRHSLEIPMLIARPGRHAVGASPSGSDSQTPEANSSSDIPATEVDWKSLDAMHGAERNR